ncbi:peptidyl-tRNA hydrolase-domain-containing protein [Geranomyces variabilis]|nr:peptidyl-tRNA hydrolase-domain-containing protein [Geranomyces variabilis]KAJ3139010.1 hypothetical protein HDU90_000916 [Geranomyces variabilis]
MCAAPRNVDFVVVGLGNPGPEYAASRHNVGYIFCDYLATCIALQRSPQSVPTRPRFVRRGDLMADVHDVEIELPSSSPQKASTAVRVLLVKPLTGMNDSALAVTNVLRTYGVANPAKQLICVFDDLNTLLGSIQLQNGGDLRSLSGHKGVESIYALYPAFIRFRVGIGRPDSPATSIVGHVLGAFQQGKEMDLLGFALDQCARALQMMVALGGDTKDAKKTYAMSKKVPKNLAKLESLTFPVETVGLTIPPTT